MKFASYSGVALAAALSFGISASAATKGASAEEKYVREVEGLLNSLPTRDQQRGQLTLKLADALFADVLRLSADGVKNPTEQKQLVSERRKAISLYESALTGLDGIVREPSRAQKAKINFQLARLYSDEGKQGAAEAIWAKLAEDDSAPDLQRESLLRMAEGYEAKGTSEGAKRAADNYKRALDLCSTFEVCSYTHYRLAWAYRNSNRLPDAVTEIQKALYDSKNQVREEPLRDLIEFLGGSGDNGRDSLALIEGLATKLKRPELTKALADSYMASGNKIAGVYVFERLNSQKPTLSASIHLLEENYSMRNWAKVTTLVDEMQTLAENNPADVQATAENAESEKILRRMSVQLDGERATKPDATEPFKQTALLYLKIFGGKRVVERKQMIEGWLNAETDSKKKIDQLAVWINEDQAAGRKDLERSWREARAAVAQTSKQYDIVQTESAALAGLAGNPDKRRELEYQHAYANYLATQGGDQSAALAEFKRLAQPPAGKELPSKWALQSEHLALDILSKQKDYTGLAAQAAVWTHDSRFDSWVKNSKEHSDELADLRKLETNGEFESAVALGEKPEALATFDRFCQAGQFLPKSCANAQVLAVKLDNGPILQRTLAKLGRTSDLAAELEASGDFAGAAALAEKDLSAKSTRKDYLKTALLYELAENNAARDRTLRAMTAKAGSSFGAEEDLIFLTLKDAGLLNESSLKLPWKKDNRSALIEMLAANDSAASRKLLATSCEATGPAWERVALTELKKLDEAQAAIHFTGRNGEAMLKKRVKALQAEVERGNCYLQSSTPRMRAIVASILAKSQAGMAAEIKAAPIPEGLDAEARAGLEKALVEMSSPFEEKAKSFSDLAQQQLEKVSDEQERAALAESLKGSDLYAIETRTASKTVASNAPVNEGLRASAMKELQKNASQPAGLAKLKDYYGSKGQPRLAAYFEGRLRQAEGAKEEVTQ